MRPLLCRDTQCPLCRRNSNQLGPRAPRRRTSASNWAKPLAWNANHAAFFAEHGHRQRVFCSSLADVFDNAVDPQWRVDLLELIAKTPNLDWLLLTKRIGNAHQMLDDTLAVMSHDLTYWDDAPWPNVWIGATIVTQQEANRDIPKLLATPAARRFLSMEPLLGPVDLRGNLPSERALRWHRPMLKMLDWVIVGGESGPGARPMHSEWARDLRDQCNTAGVPFLFKQWGDWAPADNFPDHIPSSTCDETGTMWRTGKKVAGRELDGQTYNGFPESAA